MINVLANRAGATVSQPRANASEFKSFPGCKIGLSDNKVAGGGKEEDEAAEDDDAEAAAEGTRTVPLLSEIAGMCWQSRNR